MAISILRRGDRGGRRLGRWRYLIAGVATLSVAAGAVAVSRSPLFHVRDIGVTGAAHLSRAEIVRAVGVTRETNALWLDERAAERRLERHPWIADAEVRRVYPRRVEITVAERVPVAVVVRGERAELVAADGTGLGGVERAGRLPRIELPPAPALDGAQLDVDGAAAVLGAMTPKLRADVALVHVGPDGALDLRMRDGVQVHLGTATSAGRKASALEKVLAWARVEGESLRVISLFSPHLPTVRFAD
ncbi:MAG TPA: FtsQ-type POTRA domain-containing protein [Actinomycetota bacterium]